MILTKKIFLTDDGSTSIFVPELNEQYHSKNGAIQEAYHVYIKNGLHCFEDNTAIDILEIGFGTGLNCLISSIEGQEHNYKINYVGVEAYPIETGLIKQLNYTSLLKYKKIQSLFGKMHSLGWDEKGQLNTIFSLTKQHKKFQEIKEINKFDLVYYDAFGATIQPELWTESMFKIMYNVLRKNGVLVTYAAKGSVRRAMQSVGFKVERLAGPKGKREMLRAIKN